MNDDQGPRHAFADEVTSLTQSLPEFDEATYRPYLDGLDISNEQKGEFLHLLWNIIRGMIELNVPPEMWGQIVGQLTELPADSTKAID